MKIFPTLQILNPKHFFLEKNISDKGYSASASPSNSQRAMRTTWLKADGAAKFYDNKAGKPAWRIRELLSYRRPTFGSQYPHQASHNHL